jgi:hypothetical protein
MTSKLFNKVYATLEDPVREEKIPKVTAIPEGVYLLKWRKVLSGKTKQYRKDHSWFNWHIELQDVENYKYVYIHKGNKPEDTDGCILVGSYSGNDFIYESRLSFSAFYKKLKPYLDKKDEYLVYFHVENCF